MRTLLAAALILAPPLPLLVGHYRSTQLTGTEAFIDRVTTLAAQDDPPFTLDYWRLNMQARKP